jgi:hypothetical protein
MKTWRQALMEGCRSGAIGRLASTAALASTGDYEKGTVLGPINVISRWIRGDRAAPRSADPGAYIDLY